METYTLHLHYGNGDPISVVVNSHSTITEIEPYLPSGNHQFYYKNIQLIPSFTFKWFGIEDNAHIYVRDQPESKKKRASKSSFKKKTKKFSLPQALSNENARMKDQFFSKVEGTVFCYRNIIKRFVNASSVSDLPTTPPSWTTISPPPRGGPATEQLPRFWSDHSSDEDITVPVISSPCTD
ncbi:hypothetical protein GPJ56_005587 [Histomonas meleagridis]|uniref:uncharacterized protein n=1 Tax=Histomonas meleagridis TaxID=135588 RepID=UPI00355A72DD|nr:hypothetical protein GPJ56_005587 [Histomonas meleagridis]KAH0799900.1 hypothetical protein GO595_007012 [Histomonas meleagridis]